MSEPVWDQIRLHITSDHFYLEALNNSERDVLCIDRNHETVCTMQLLSAPVIPPARTIMHVYGYIGSIKLIAGLYLVVITKRSRVGTLHSGHSVWKIEETELIPYTRNTAMSLNAGQRQHNNQYLKMIKQQLATPSFYRV